MTKAKIKIFDRFGTGYGVRFAVEHQSFTLEYDGVHEEVVWLARMLQKALAKGFEVEIIDENESNKLV